MSCKKKLTTTDGTPPAWSVGTWVYPNYPGATVQASSIEAKKLNSPENLLTTGGLTTILFNNQTPLELTITAPATGAFDSACSPISSGVFTIGGSNTNCQTVIEPNFTSTGSFTISSSMSGEAFSCTATFASGALSMGACTGTNAANFNISVTSGKAPPYAISIQAKNVVETWLTQASSLINGYNNAASTANKINMIYFYGSDLEFQLDSTKSLSEIVGLTNTYGFWLNSSLSTNYTYFKNMITDTTNEISYVAIVDGRIDNGYLQGMNELNETEALALANLVVLGQTSGGAATNNGLAYYSPNAENAEKITITGVQFDIEPFDDTQSGQINFFTAAGGLLKTAGQYFSLFTYPKRMTAASANMLGDNGYFSIALYDLQDMTTIPSYCLSNLTDPMGVGCTPDSNCPSKCSCDVSHTPPPVTFNPGYFASPKTAKVPFDYSVIAHSPAGYGNAAYLAVMQTIALAQKYKIKYKFAIPASASVHEFTDWGIYSYQMAHKFAPPAGIFYEAFSCNYCSYQECETPCQAPCETLCDGSCIQAPTGWCTSSCTNPTTGATPCTTLSGGTSIQGSYCNGICSNTTDQQDYIVQAIQAINKGIQDANAQGLFDAQYFRGIDIYGFNSETIWTPAGVITDNEDATNFCLGGVYDNSSCTNCSGVCTTSEYCGMGMCAGPGGSLYPPYIYTNPPYPSASILQYIAENLPSQNPG